MIGGRDGAAERLGLPRTTLIYKMRKLGIKGHGDRGEGNGVPFPPDSAASFWWFFAQPPKQ